MSDARLQDDLIEAFQTGQSDATATVRSWVDRVVFFEAWSFADREAVAQDILLRLLQAIRAGRFRGEATFRTFVRSIAKNTCIDAHRRARLRDRIEVPVEFPDRIPSASINPEGERLAGERLELLRHVIQKLSDECRRLWNWVYQDRLSARQVAARLGTTEGAVRARVHRCLNRARQLARDAQSESA